MNRNLRPDKPKGRVRKIAGTILIFVAFGVMAHAFIALAPALEWFAGIGLLLLSAALLADTSSQQQ